MCRAVRRNDKEGFTLIELLIVVAIIAILAAIAVPNFLEAQTRAKVSRAEADLRTIATALEAYAVDHNKYPPNDGDFNVVPVQLTSPVAFITNAYLIDPFNDEGTDDPLASDRDLTRYYTYTQTVRINALSELPAIQPVPPGEAVDFTGFNPGALDRYGHWRLVSNGPDRAYRSGNMDPGPFNPNPPALQGADIPYDPTNGTRSVGNILRTQRQMENR